jgi:hypothetical protein
MKEVNLIIYTVNISVYVMTYPPVQLLSKNNAPFKKEKERFEI